MTNNPEFVTVIAGGVPYGGWKKVTIQASMDKAVRTFSLTTTEHPGGFAFPPGTPVQILANGTPMLDGYVNRYCPRFDKQSHDVQLSGRSKGQDLTDCSAKDKKGVSSWKNKDIGEVAQDLDNYGVGIKAEVKLDKMEKFHLEQGETAYQAIERGLRDQGATLMADENGSGCVITNAEKAKRHAGGLIEGFNILSAQGVLSDDRKHSEYEVKGQRRHGKGEANLRISEKHKASGKRYRNKIIVHEEDSTPGRARKRAQHEGDRAEGFSISATITTQGWRDDGGQVWQPNYLIFVSSPMLKIEQDMLIESVTFEQDDSGGSTAQIHVVHPKAYKGKAGKSKSDGAWG